MLGSDNSSPYNFNWNSVGAGNYTITAKATDNSGAVATSSSIVVSVSTPNVAPAVSITSPVANATFYAPATITISAAASDADGSISKVEFYNGNTLLGSDNSSPYSFSWNSVAAGNYTITAKATDNSGAVSTSSSIVVLVSTPNAAPAVSITSPVANTIFDAPASITISAAASDADGSISKVEFYNGNTLLGSDNSSPYNFNWNNVGAGTYTITAKATDNNGAVSTSSSTVVSVSTPNVAPAVSITSPVANATFDTSVSITISAAASDADGSISKVEFYNEDTLLTTQYYAPYSWPWQNVAVGTYTITAKAYDNSGAITISSSVTVSVSTPNAAPTVSITSPIANATFDAPANITMSAAASDADGSISKVEFYNDTTLLHTEYLIPYSWTWQNAPAGNYTITAKATDNSGLTTTSSGISISVTNPNIAPLVSITSPLTNATFNAPASITISAVASDADGSISKVEYYNGNTLLGSDNSSPYNFNWNSVGAGNYTITAKAIDNSGAVATSSSIVVSVSTPNVAPAVSITSPVANATFNAPASVTISAVASDADGSISKVEFYNGNTLLGSDNSSPYNFSWNSVAAGNYTIISKATDNSGAVSTSSSIVVLVSTPNAAPAVSITSPVANTTFYAPASITISAAASDADGSISKVEFYNDNTLLGSDNSSPYNFSWSNVAAGNYTITAKATDNGGAVTISSSIVVLVSTPNAAPGVSITSPEANSIFDAPASITISAAASDADGSISKVEFYNGNTLLESDNSGPYNFSWNSVAAGNYTITAKATDNSGAVTTSSSIVVTVSPPDIAPTVSIISPVSNTSYDSAQSITLEAAASDIDGTVIKVDFYNGDILIGTKSTSPYTFTWDKVAPGSYSFKAKAYDNKGAATVSATVPVVVSSPIAFAFTSFEGTASLTGNQLAWSTTNYKSTSYFRVLRGQRRMSMKQIGKVNYANSSLSSLNYTFIDASPYSGTNYYKIVEVDNFGKVVSSNTIAISKTAGRLMTNGSLSGGNISTDVAEERQKMIGSNLETIVIKIGPNPASNTLSVVINGAVANKETRISILSINGILLKTISANTSRPVVRMDVSSLSPGTYIVQAISGDRIVNREFIKQ